MKARIFIEGAGQSKEYRIRCRAAFRKLLENAGFDKRQPQLLPCGGRQMAFDDFVTALGEKRKLEFVAMLVDSEDPVTDIEQTWRHLHKRDSWSRPTGATDEQVLLMTTTMETWIAFDRAALRSHFKHCLQEKALPPAHEIEKRARATVLTELTNATRTCKTPYAKGDKSFVLLALLDPQTLAKLPSFARILRILNAHL